MTNNRVERKRINRELCDVYFDEFDENGEVILVHWVGIGGIKWGIQNPPVPNIENISNQCTQKCTRPVKSALI